jgi:hypothetical protein
MFADFRLVGSQAEKEAISDKSLFTARGKLAG